MMRRALPTILAALAFCALAAAPASADRPWWQVLTGSRPAHISDPVADREVQEVEVSKTYVVTDEDGEPVLDENENPVTTESSAAAARVEVKGETVGCLGTGTLFGIFPADAICLEQTEFGAAETAGELKAMLEAAGFEEGVEVSGGPVDSAPFEVSTEWGAPTISVSALPNFFDPEEAPLGSASAEIVSEGSGRLTLVLTNLGDAPLDATEVPLQITDELPEGLLAYSVEAAAGTVGSAGEVDCAVAADDLVRCSFEEQLPAYEAIEIDVLVALVGDPGQAGTVTVSGGDGPDDEAPQPLNLGEGPVPFGLEGFQMRAEAEGGGEAAEAATHPFQLTTTVQFRSGRQTRFGVSRAESRVEQPALVRNVRIELPAGLAGSAIATPTCELAVFLSQENLVNECPDSAAVGVASVTVRDPTALGLARVAVPVFALPPQRGEPARLGFMPAGVPVLIETSIDPADDYRLIAEVRNAPQAAKVLSSTVSIWGEPGDSSHDDARGWGCAYFSGAEFIGCPDSFEGLSSEPLLRLPASCAAPFAYEARVEAWNGAGADSASAPGGPLRGCNQVPFAPGVSAALTSKAAESPSGLDFELEQSSAWPKNPKPGARAEAQARRVEVALPEGVTVNPSQAEGLATCSEADFGRERYDSGPGEGCPEASKIGSIAGSSPLIAEPFQGALYIAEPYENPFEALIALYLVARVPERGVLVKQAGVVEPDPRTGRLVSTFDDLPQLPYKDFKLHFREGGRSPLVTPPACGRYATTARFVPHSAQDPDHPRPGEIVGREAATEIERGVGGGPCPAGGAPPFAPGFSAGSLNNQANSYSPFVMRLTRKDGDQDMTKFSAVLPEGLVPRLAGTPWCPEAQIAAARSRTGKEELAAPSCPAASQVGRILAGAGVGSVLTHVPGSLYLAGPFRGAPLSAVAVVPAVAGPFDVGTVVTRVGLRLNPTTYRGEVDGSASEPIPHILAGIPLKVRDIQVFADRPAFTRNPTSCAEMATEATLFGSFQDLFSSADDVPVGLASRYQAAGCRGLAFKPRLGLKLKGKPRRGGFPALRAHYRPREGHANLKRLALTFPSSAFIEQGHFRTICTRVQFAAGEGHGSECPKGSVYGRARVWTPLLDEPLAGPVFLRSSNNNLPDAVFALHGPPSAPVRIEVAVEIDSVGGRLRARVKDAPDAPVSRAIVDMQGGRKGLIVNSRNLCFKAKRNRARVNLRGHNGAKRLLRPVARAVACAKKRKAKRASVSAGRVADRGGSRR